jgi:RimJ/RimL family protein N-acetyltransferase
METARLLFRPWSEGDLDLALGLWGDAEVTRLIGGPFSREQVRERLERERASLDGYGVQYWPVFLRDGGGHVGCCGLRPYRVEEGVYEIGFHIRSAHWGHGYASEAARTVIAHAFGTLRAVSLFAGHHPANEGSRRLLEKLGFRYTHHEFYPPTKLEHPSYLLTAEIMAASRVDGHGGAS